LQKCLNCHVYRVRTSVIDVHKTSWEVWKRARLCLRHAARTDLRGNTTRATLVALFHYRLGVTWIGVLL